MKQLQIIIFLVIAFAIYACEKDSPPEEEPDQTLEFQSLIADRDTIVTGETTGITALAKGYQITYHWSASSGAILGSGSRVTYASAPCACGGSRISCQVIDGYEQTDMKTIIIVVQ